MDIAEATDRPTIIVHGKPRPAPMEDGVYMTQERWDKMVENAKRAEVLTGVHPFTATGWELAACVLMAEVERLQAIVDKLPRDAAGNVYPPPRALKGKVFYHPGHLGAAEKLFSQLYWDSSGYWGVACGGWEVPLSECYSTREAAEERGD